MTPLRDHELKALANAKRMAASIDGIAGVDFGFIYKDWVRTRRKGIRFHVRQKVADDDLRPSQLLPAEFSGLPCDVVQASYEPHAANPKLPHDPVLPGISVGNLLRQTTGTLGCFVSDAAGGRFILSNWHILSGSPASEAGEAIIQPGPAHLSSIETRTVAHLSRWTNLSHGIDAALAAVAPGVAVNEMPLGLNVKLAGIVDPKPGLKLVKQGVSSGRTHAMVDGVAGSYVMDYTSYGDQQRWMDGFRLVPDPESPSEEISLGGDSGALWIETATGRACALHFGGEDGVGPLAEYAVAHPLRRVLELLDVRLPG